MSNPTPNYYLDKNKHDELIGVLEDSVQYVCSEQMISGELAWLIVQTFAEAKVAEFKLNNR